MPISNLTSIPTKQFYSAQPAVEAEVLFPASTEADLDRIMTEAEDLYMGPNRVHLEINGKQLSFDSIVADSDDRQGAQILTAIASKLANVSTGPDGLAPAAAHNDMPSDQVRAADHANFEIAALLSSNAFWHTVDTAVRQSLAKDSMTGGIELLPARQVGMNVTMSKDGKDLECHIQTAWHEFRQNYELHRMSDATPVLTTNLKIRLPLQHAGSFFSSVPGGYDLQARVTYVHSNSPLPEVVKWMSRRKTTIGQAILNLLASIPLLGRLCRGVILETAVGKDFDNTVELTLPHKLSPDTPWFSSTSAVVTHTKNSNAAMTHLIAHKTESTPNGHVRLQVDGDTVRRVGASGVASATLKTALERRPDDLRRKREDLGGFVPADTPLAWKAYAEHVESRLRDAEAREENLARRCTELEAAAAVQPVQPDAAARAAAVHELQRRLDQAEEQVRRAYEANDQLQRQNNELAEQAAQAMTAQNESRRLAERLSSQQTELDQLRARHEELNAKYERLQTWAQGAAFVRTSGGDRTTGPEAALGRERAATLGSIAMPPQILAEG